MITESWDDICADLEDYRKSMYKRSAKVRKILAKLKARTPCAECGGSFPAEAMDFDHVRGKKLFMVSQPPTGVQASTLIAEIEKCEIVCSNCHRTRTRDRALAFKALQFKVESCLPREF